MATSSPRRLPAWVDRTAPRLGAAFVAAFVAWLATGWGGPERAKLITALFFLVPAPVAGTLALRAAAHPRMPARGRVAWRVYGAAALLNWVGSTLWTSHGVLHPGAPTPHWVDALSLLATPLYVVGILTFPTRARAGGGRVRFAFDAGLIVVAGALATWYFGIRPAPPDAALPAIERALAVAYPLGDYVIMLAVAAVMIRRPAPLFAQPLRILAFGQGMAATGDIAYAFYQVTGGSIAGRWFFLLFMAAWAFAWAAAWEQRAVLDHAAADPAGAAPEAPAADGQSLLPYAFVLLGFAVVGAATRPFWATQVGVALLAGAVLTVLLIARQIAALRANRQLLAAHTDAEARYRRLFDQNPGPMWVYDVETQRIVDVNAAAVAHYGHTRDEFVGMSIRELRPASEYAAFDALMAEQPAGRVTDRVVRHQTRDGRLLEVELTSDSVEFEGRDARVVLANDVTARRALETELARQALHDALTGLPNRTLFRERVGRVAAGRRPGGPRAAVLFLDLDDFKTTNDTLGHAAGDALLCAVAERLLEATRGSDTVARLGGDEFAILLDRLGGDGDLDAVTDRIQRALARPVSMADREVHPRASIGVAFAEPGEPAETWLRNADLAMYAAKAAGKGGVAHYTDRMHDALRDRLELEGALRAAVAQGQLHLAYQPVVELAGGAPVGAEALLRWTHPTRGLVSPAQFIPLAEATGVIVPIGAWVLRTACAEAAGWSALPNASGPAPAGAAPSVAVNVSGRQLLDPGFVGTVRAALADTGLAPARLTLEVTESVLLEESDRAAAVLGQLKALGVRVAIDDFGTGYSSLAYLQRFPVDVLKIDKAFVDHLGRGPRHDALLRTIIDLGRGLGLETVAEGVEHAHQRAQLAGYGCARAQGYLFARPLAPAALRAFWAEGAGAAERRAA